MKFSQIPQGRNIEIGTLRLIKITDEIAMGRIYSRFNDPDGRNQLKSVREYGSSQYNGSVIDKLLSSYGYNEEIKEEGPLSTLEQWQINCIIPRKITIVNNGQTKKKTGEKTTTIERLLWLPALSEILMGSGKPEEGAYLLGDYRTWQKIPTRTNESASRIAVHHYREKTTSSVNHYGAFRYFCVINPNVEFRHVAEHAYNSYWEAIYSDDLDLSLDLNKLSNIIGE